MSVIQEIIILFINMLSHRRRNKRQICPTFAKMKIKLTFHGTYANITIINGILDNIRDIPN